MRSSIATAQERIALRAVDARLALARFRDAYLAGVQADGHDLEVAAREYDAGVLGRAAALVDVVGDTALLRELGERAAAPLRGRA